MTDPVITTLQGRVAAVETEVDKLRSEAGGARAALQGAWGTPGLVERVRTVEAQQAEIRTMLGVVKQQQEVHQSRQADRDADREHEQHRRDKRMNVYLTAILGLVGTVLATIVVNAFTAGVAP